MEKYGIIYADFAHSVENGSWGNQEYLQTYSYTSGENFKNYYVDGRYEEGPFPANDILVAEGEGNERFLIMALEDASISQYSGYFRWQSYGTEQVATEFGIGPEFVGKTNTETILGVWKEDENKNANDMWSLIEDNSNWFVPSSGEWIAFSDAFGIDQDNYNTTYGLKSSYHTSSGQVTGGSVGSLGRIEFDDDWGGPAMIVRTEDPGFLNYVRLSAAF